MSQYTGTLPLLAYRLIACAAAPWVRLALRRRARAGREDVVRLGERMGRSGRARPAGPVVWFHAASVGELLSLLPLLRALPDDLPAFTPLVTTGTVTSAAIAAERLPPRAIHQYAPVDLSAPVGRFLRHWRPSLALRVESELWPNQIEALRAAETPALLVNARLSPRSEARWRRVSGLARRLMGAFAAVLAQSPEDAGRLEALGAREVRYVGNLKAAAEPLPADPAQLAAIAQLVAGRPSWVLASSHEGEEVLAGEVHRALAEVHPGLLTVIVPRHPARGPAIAAALRRAGLKAGLRSAGAEPGAGAGVYVADTLGELGLWYRATAVAAVAGSLVPHGGHNPLEPAILERPVLFGPHMGNFRGLADGLLAAGGAAAVTATTLADDVGRLLADEDRRDQMAAAAAAYAFTERRATDGVAAAVEPWFRALG